MLKRRRMRGSRRGVDVFVRSLSTLPISFVRTGVAGTDFARTRTDRSQVRKHASPQGPSGIHLVRNRGSASCFGARMDMPTALQRRDIRSLSVASAILSGCPEHRQ